MIGFLKRAICIVALLPLLGCTGKSDEPDGFIKVCMESVEQGKPEVMWTSLPASYQKDVTDIVHDFGTKMDPEVWDKSFEVIGKLQQILEGKREFILNMQMLQGMQQQLPKEDLDTLLKFFSATFGALVKSDMRSVEALQTVDMKKLITDLGKAGHAMKDEMMKLAEKQAEMAGPGAPPEFQMAMAMLESMKVEVINTSGDSATLKLSADGEEPKELAVKKVEGVWLPAELVDGWAQNIAMARQQVAQIQVSEEDKMQFQMVVQMVEPTLDRLLAANTKDEFEAVIMGTVQQFMPMLGGGGMGGGIPGMPR